MIAEKALAVNQFAITCYHTSKARQPMKVKLFEIRDSGTFIQALAIKIECKGASEQERYLLRRCGFGERGGYAILLHHLQSDKGSMDVYNWPKVNGDLRTMPQAHAYLEKHFDELESGSVIDIEYILGEKPTKKISEREETNDNQT